MPDDLSALSAKMDFLIDRLEKQDEKITRLQQQFDQSRGALALVKIGIWIAGVGAAIFAAFHGMKV